MACLTPPLADVPDGDWYCPLCQTLRTNDVHYKMTARVRVFWAAPEYNDYYRGYVIGVRAATDDELAAAEGKVARGAPIYKVYYSGDDVQWEFLKESDFTQADERATELARGADRRLGRRVQVEFPQSASAAAGWYAGVVSDLCVERHPDRTRTVYKVRYDEGDVHWHVLEDVNWVDELDTKRVAKAAAHGVNSRRTVPLVKRSRSEMEAQEAAAMAAREVAREAAARYDAAAQERAREKADGLRGWACERLERALLCAVTRERAESREHDDKEKEKEKAARAAEFAEMYEALMAHRGEPLAALLRSLTPRRVEAHALRSSGVAKLVGRLSRLDKKEAIAMAADAAEAVKAAAAELATSWQKQIDQAKSATSANADGAVTSEEAEPGALSLAAAGSANDSKAWAAAAERARAIVECIFVEFDVDDARKTKVRALVANLSEPTNLELRQRVLSKELKPAALVAMNHDDLAPPQLQLQRQASKEASKRAVTHW